MNEEHDHAELRLRAADPAGPSRPLPPPRIPRAELIEAIMTTTDDLPAPATPTKASPTRWLLAAAAVIVAAAVATTVSLTAGGNSSHPKTVAHLSLPKAGGGPAGTCLRFTVDILRDKAVAFSGTAEAVTDDDVVLDVDHWYKGGTADQVELANPNVPGIALEGGIQFVVGHRYLVSADDATVSMCGYSGEWSAEMEQSYQDAFGS